MNVIINGASRGIGKSIVDILGEAYNVQLFGISRTTPKESMRCTKFIKCDSTKRYQVKTVVEKIIKKYRTIDVLVNVVGDLKISNLIDETEQNLDKTYKTNVKSYWYFVKEVLPYMVKQKNGYIINISSMQAIRTFKGKSSYAMSKAAINSLTEAINREHNSEGIRSTAICPGYVDTGLIDGLNTDGEGLLEPKDVSKTVEYLLNLSKNAIIQEIHLERKLW